MKTDTAVEMTLVTIATRSDYEGSASVEAFAKGLFNSWGVGRRTYNDGILLLVAVEDRECACSLGAGYDQGYNVLAQDIVNRWIIPEFRDGNFGVGIEAGVSEIIPRIATRHSQGLPPAAAPIAKKGLFERIFPWLFGAVAAGIVGIEVFGRRLGDWNYRFHRCPSCGVRGLHCEQVPPAGVPDSALLGRTVITCTRCEYRDDRQQTFRNDDWSGGGGSSGGGSFGGGRSSGGGATGRW